MFHIRIVGSDAFLSMPPTAQLLYFHLGMRADEDGFVNNVLPTIRAAGLRKRDLEVLLERRFVLMMDDILVIKHFRMANSLRNDRLRVARYPAIADRLYICPNGAYTDHPVAGGVTLSHYKQDCLRQKSSRRTYGDRKDSPGDSHGNPMGIPWESK